MTQHLRALLLACTLSAPAFAQTAAPVSGSADSAKSKVSMCVGCHGIPDYHTAYPEVYHVPKIAGQAPGYLVAALNAYKSGERAHPTMRAVAAGLSAKDIADVAAYYANAVGGAGK